MRGRKFDERKKKRVVHLRGRERELESGTKREKKLLKKIYAHAIVPVHICTGTVATCIYTQVYPN